MNLENVEVVENSVWYSVYASVWYSVYASVWDSVVVSVWNSVSIRLQEPIREERRQG